MNIAQHDDRWPGLFALHQSSSVVVWCARGKLERRLRPGNQLNLMSNLIIFG